MSIVHVITALGSSFPLASRAFVPLFVVSLLSNPTFHRLCPDWLQHICLRPPDAMAWIGNPWFLLGVGILAALECLADKNDDLKELIEKAQVFLKSAVAILVALAILPPETKQVTHGATAAAGMAMWNTAIAAAAGTCTYFIARARARIYEEWFEIDDGDDFGLRFIVSFLEDFWAVLAIPLFLVLSTFTVVLVLILLATVLGVSRLLDHLEDRRRVPCAACGAEILPTAGHCRHCKTARSPGKVMTWNLFFGRSYETQQTLTKSRKRSHMLRLPASRRCPACAERLKLQTFLADGCPTCGFRFPDNDWYDVYRGAVIGRAFRLLLPLLLLSWIPALGIAAAIVAIKVLLVAPLRMFLRQPAKFWLKWGMRVFTFLLLLLGSLPFFSIFAVPVLVIVHILVYGHAAKKAVAAAPSPGATEAA